MRAWCGHEGGHEAGHESGHESGHEGGHEGAVWSRAGHGVEDADGTNGDRRGGRGQTAATTAIFLRAPFAKSATDIRRAVYCQGMPSVIFRDEKRWFRVASCLGRDRVTWCYLLPPIQYPDGKTIIKLGANTIQSLTDGGGRELPTHEEVRSSVPCPPPSTKTAVLGSCSYDCVASADAICTAGLGCFVPQVVQWYRGEGDVDLKEMNLGMLHEIVPDLTPLNVRSNTCVTAHTPTTLPFIGPVLRQSGTDPTEHAPCPYRTSHSARVARYPPAKSNQAASVPVHSAQKRL
eukprot:52732-Rhodomonas_salina.1